MCHAIYILLPALASRSAFRAPITPFSQTSGAWACRWWRWPSDVSPSRRLMPRNWNRSLASQWRGKQAPASPLQGRGPLADQAAVSLRTQSLILVVTADIYECV